MRPGQIVHVKVEREEEPPGDFEVCPRGVQFVLYSHVLVVLDFLERFFLGVLHYAGIPLHVRPPLELRQEQHHGDVAQ